MKATETWRDIPSLPGVIVSDRGRVMVIPYRGKMPNGGVRPYGGIPHKGVVGDGGRAQLFYKGRCYRIHKLVAEAFHGPSPFRGGVVMHKDENVANNCAGNLKWGTQKENLNCPKFLAYCRSRTGENSPTIKGRKKAA